MNQGTSRSIRVQKGQMSKPGVSNPTTEQIWSHEVMHASIEQFSSIESKLLLINHRIQYPYSAEVNLGQGYYGSWESHKLENLL